MARNLVVATEKETWSAGGAHRHASALGLVDGRRVGRSFAILNLELGLASYYMVVGGRDADVRILARCARCGFAHLQVDDGASDHDALLELRDV